MRDERRTHTDIVAAAWEDGTLTTVERIRHLRRWRYMDGTWSEWVENLAEYRLDGAPLNMLDDSTLQVVRTGKRLTIRLPTGTP